MKITQLEIRENFFRVGGYTRYTKMSDAYIDGKLCNAYCYDKCELVYVYISPIEELYLA
jgi:hypothetical protein